MRSKKNLTISIIGLVLLVALSFFANGIVASGNRVEKVVNAEVSSSITNSIINLKEVGVQMASNIPEEAKSETLEVVDADMEKESKQEQVEETLSQTETVEALVEEQEPTIQEAQEESQLTVEVEPVQESNLDNSPQLSAVSEDDLYILSHVIYGESSGSSWDFQIAVGSVVLNRVASSDYPNSIHDVVFQSGQYACTWDGNYNKIPDQQAIDVARYLLSNGSQIPADVVFQAEFVQGNGVWKQLGNTFFCYR